jgi:hypothetical protein
MTKVTNRGDGARGFNVPTGAGGSRAVLLQPGESMDLDLTEAAHHTLAGWVASGDLVLDEADDASTNAAKIAADADALAKRQAEAAEAEKEEAEKRAKAAEAISKDADANAEHADAELRAQRAGDPPPTRRETSTPPPTRGAAPPRGQPPAHG